MLYLGATCSFPKDLKCFYQVYGQLIFKIQNCYVWDLDGKKYTDLATMSVGTNILGYSNNKIDKSIIKTIKNGNMSSLNCPEEVYLSEKLIKMHKGFDMVRFAKTGGEANSIAVRIARLFLKKIILQFVVIMGGMTGIYQQTFRLRKIFPITCYLGYLLMVYRKS